MRLPFPDDSSPDVTSPAETRALVALTLVPGIGGRRLQALVAGFGTPSRVWKASRAALQRVPGIGKQYADAIRTFDPGEAVDRQFRLAERVGAEVITLWDEQYPALLKQIYDPPAILWMRGTLQPEDAHALAVVGTRSCTDYGRAQARRLSDELVAQGLTVVSGLAYGIDAVAHRAALDAGGRTIAVLGSGLARVYPKRHAHLADRISKQGAVLSEFPLDTDPDAPNFPERNRIVSGLTLGTLVVESKAEGGALITARMACDQNREVFAVPGDVGRAASVGTNQLIQRGHGKLVLSATDVLDELPAPRGTAEPTPAPITGPGVPDAPALPPDGDARVLYDALSTTPIHLDTLCDRTGVPTPAALAALLELEMTGHVRQLAGKQFRRA